MIENICPNLIDMQHDQNDLMMHVYRDQVLTSVLTVISCGLPAGYAIFFHENMVLQAICRCGLSDLFFAVFFND
jgi:hypothetical protein